MSGTDHEIRHVTSTSNPVVKLARRLATQRRLRYRERLFLIEGERAIRTALEHGTEIHTMIIDDERRVELDPAFVVSLTRQAQRTISVPSALFVSFTDAEHPQPLAAIAVMPRTTLPSNASSIVALDAVRDPGNLGTIIRTARAAGVDGIALLPDCVDPYNPKVVRSSAGLVTAIPIDHIGSVSDIKATCFDPEQSAHVIATDADGQVHYRDVHWEEPVVIVVGNEATGLSDTTRRETSQRVRIPMADGVESLNVSVATGVLLFEMFEARHGRRD